MSREKATSNVAWNFTALKAYELEERIESIKMSMGVGK